MSRASCGFQVSLEQYQATGGCFLHIRRPAQTSSIHSPMRCINVAICSHVVRFTLTSKHECILTAVNYVIEFACKYAPCFIYIVEVLWK